MPTLPVQPRAGARGRGDVLQQEVGAWARGVCHSGEWACVRRHALSCAASLRPMPRPAQPRVRRARRSDLDALNALEQRCFRGDRLSARQYRFHLDSDRAWLGVVARGDALAGSALVMFRADTNAARLYSIAVDPAARGGGLGLALLRGAERAARARGADEMRLEVRAGNRAAIALYEREGYACFGRKRRYYEDGADALRFAKAL